MRPVDRFLHPCGLDEKRPSGAMLFFEDDQPVIESAFFPLEIVKHFSNRSRFLVRSMISGMGSMRCRLALNRSMLPKSASGGLCSAGRKEHFSHVIKDPTSVVGVLADRYDLAFRMNVFSAP